MVTFYRITGTGRKEVVRWVRREGVTQTSAFIMELSAHGKVKRSDYSPTLRSVRGSVRGSMELGCGHGGMEWGGDSPEESNTDQIV